MISLPVWQQIRNCIFQFLNFAIVALIVKSVISIACFIFTVSVYLIFYFFYYFTHIFFWSFKADSIFWRNPCFFAIKVIFTFKNVAWNERIYCVDLLFCSVFCIQNTLLINFHSFLNEPVLKPCKFYWNFLNFWFIKAFYVKAFQACIFVCGKYWIKFLWSFFVPEFINPPVSAAPQSAPAFYALSGCYGKRPSFLIDFALHLAYPFIFFQSFIKAFFICCQIVFYFFKIHASLLFKIFFST